MTNLRNELNLVISAGNITGISFVRLTKWKWVLNKIANSFLAEGVKDLERFWLWEAFKGVCISSKPESSIDELKCMLNIDERYFFIVSAEDGKYWVMEGKGEAVIRILANGPYFEYYIVDKAITWLVCENHDGVFIRVYPKKP